MASPCLSLNLCCLPCLSIGLPKACVLWLCVKRRNKTKENQQKLTKLKRIDGKAKEKKAKLNGREP